MTDTMQQITRSETNRLIRADLKATHPGTAFTVRSVNGADVMQTVIGWEITYHRMAADFDGYYSPGACTLASGPTEADIDALAARYSAWEWRDGTRDFAPTAWWPPRPVNCPPSSVTVPEMSQHGQLIRTLTSNTANTTIRSIRSIRGTHERIPK